ADLEGGPGSPRPAAPDMRDAARLERAYLDSEAASRDAAAWLDRLQQAPPVTDLAADHPRPAVQSYRGAGHRFAFTATTTRALQSQARAQGVTPYAALLASFVLLLPRYTGSEALVVGAPSPGRTGRRTHAVVVLL